MPARSCWPPATVTASSAWSAARPPPTGWCCPTPPWVNQAEIYFSVVHRKVVAPNDFTHLDQVRQRLADFEPRYNATARPLPVVVHPADLDDLLARIDQHQQQTAARTIPQAA